jgi:hypothetical protein
MSDRELLELAAKAAGIELAYWNDGQECYSSGEGFVLPSNALWNPLRADGACSRLEAVLGIGTDWWIAPEAGAAVWCGVVTPENTIFDAVCYFADHGGDRQAARRRASTMVAAAMQKAKEAACN